MEVRWPGAWGLALPTQTRVEHPISQPYPQPSHEPRPPNPAPAPNTRHTDTRSPAEKTLPSKAMGRGGRGRKALKKR